MCRVWHAKIELLPGAGVWVLQHSIPILLFSAIHHVSYKKMRVAVRARGRGHAKRNPGLLVLVLVLRISITEIWPTSPSFFALSLFLVARVHECTGIICTTRSHTMDRQVGTRGCERAARQETPQTNCFREIGEWIPARQTFIHPCFYGTTRNEGSP